MLPIMQCDNPSTVTHLLLHFLIGKNHEREEKNKQKSNMLQFQTVMGERFLINKEPGTSVKVSSLFQVRLLWQKNAY